MVRPCHLLLLCLLLLALPEALRAEDFPSAGAFARGRAGMAVLATDAGAVLGNPAALGLHQAGTTVDLSALGSVASGNAGGDYGAALGVELGYLARLPGKARWTPVFGLLVQTPVDGAFRLKMPANDSQFWPQLALDETTTRLAAGLAVEAVRGLVLGASVEYVPGVDGFVRLDLDDPDGRNQVEIQVRSSLGPTFGLLWRPAPSLDLGLAYSLELPANLDMPVRVLASSIDINARVLGQLFARPAVLRAGGALHLNRAWTLRGELHWARYSALPSPYADLELYDAQGEDGLAVNRPDLDLKDALVAKVGADWQTESLLLGGALSLETPACEDSNGVANARCATIYRVGAALAAPLSKDPLALTGHLEAGARFTGQEVLEKNQVLPGNPGYPSARQGAVAWEFSGGLSFDFR
jgi:hypothetical protein